MYYSTSAGSTNVGAVSKRCGIEGGEEGGGRNSGTPFWQHGASASPAVGVSAVQAAGAREIGSARAAATLRVAAAPERSRSPGSGTHGWKTPAPKPARVVARLPGLAAPRSSSRTPERIPTQRCG